MIVAVIEAALTVLFGAVAGGVTNSLAIWMLFHPYEPPRALGRRLRFFQGAIPKNRARLAAAIGRTVGTRLLTPEDLARTVADPAFRDAFDARLARFLGELFEREWGSLNDTLPATVIPELQGLLRDAAAGLLDRLDSYLASSAFQAAARDWAESLANRIGDESIGQILTPEREAALTATAERWIDEAVGGEEIGRAHV